MPDEEHLREKAAVPPVPSKGGEPRSNESVLSPPSGGMPEEARGGAPAAASFGDAIENELSPEDAALSERLTLAVSRICEAAVAGSTGAGVLCAAVEVLRSEVRGATSSLTSVPKPFKYLAPYWPALRRAHAALEPGAAGATALADVLSVLAMTMGGAGGARDCLNYALATGGGGAGAWGGEYVRHLSGEVGAEYQARLAVGAPVTELLALAASELLPYNLAHNAEVEAVDLAFETDLLDALTAPGAVDEASHARVCLYLLKAADYLGDASEAALAQEISFKIYCAHRQFAQAVIAALRLGGPRAREHVSLVFAACSDSGVRRQMGHLLGRHRLMSFIARDEEVDTAIGNSRLAALYAALARDLDVVEAKMPEDIYKTHLVGNADRGGGGTAVRTQCRQKRSLWSLRVPTHAHTFYFLPPPLPLPLQLESAKNNLASTYVNAWVNAGFGHDKLVSPADSMWVFRNKDSGLIAAAASLGMINLWDETKLDSLDKYLNADDEKVRAGAGAWWLFMWDMVRSPPPPPYHSSASSAPIS